MWGKETSEVIDCYGHWDKEEHHLFCAVKFILNFVVFGFHSEGENHPLGFVF